MRETMVAWSFIVLCVFALSTTWIDVKQTTRIEQLEDDNRRQIRQIERLQECISVDGWAGCKPW